MTLTCVDLSSEPLCTIVPQTVDINKRLDRFLNERFPTKSRTQIKRMIEAGQILVEGRATKASYRIRGNEQVQVMSQQDRHSAAYAEPIPLSITYEDTDLAVVDKPAGMVVHSGAGNPSGTLVNALLHHFKFLSQVGGADRPGIVHRLDKQTSGLIVIAKNDFCHQKLAQQFESREISKQYIALVHGRLGRDSGEITSAIGRDRVHRVKMTTRAARSREALTHYQVLERFPNFTLLQLRIKTGRTHQIRVHLSSIKHPVVGDTLYGAPSRIAIQKNEAVATLPRNFLHASQLEFSHPRTQERLIFTSTLPQELASLLLTLRRDS
jgi:23S rRNA pseudouridine1911/1915/1917 synthase